MRMTHTDCVGSSTAKSHLEDWVTVYNVLRSAECFKYGKFKDKPKLQKHHIHARLKFATSNV